MSSRRKKDQTLAQALGALLEKVLVPDLRARARASAVAAALKQRHDHERAQERTAEPLEPWVDQTVEQVGAAWILSCVFVRTLEDRGLVARRRLAGEGAADSEHYFDELAPSLNARDYLLSVFRELSRFPGTEELLGPKGNAAWRLTPSGPAAQALLDFFRERKEDGALRWTFGAPAGEAGADTRDGHDTRFLGDLYQDLSQSVRERYALLQTPDFVERFILGLTLDPAIREFGLEEVRVIDPTCGSGHFLLGAYDRLFEARLAAKPGLDRRQHALDALAQVYGVDINPYAVAIARFRLTLAYLHKAGIDRLADAPRLPPNLVVADSLLYGARGVTRELGELAESKEGWGDDLFRLEEPDRAVDLLSRGYHAVVGNPPYITCRDGKLRDRYRKLYRSCYREYALAAPFTERFFQLAVPSGFVGLINANSFMKREFGKKLVEEVLPKLDLTHVIDTSGAFIPGHGTPTVILVGRNQAPVSEAVRGVLGKRGEPESPAIPEQGRVWSAVAARVGQVGYEDEFISVTNVARVTLAQHPWSLGGGGAAELKAALEKRCERRLRDVVKEIGFGAVTREDDVFLLGAGAVTRAGIREAQRRALVVGESIRDWSIAGDDIAIWPYDAATLEPVAGDAAHIVERFLFPWRTQLLQRVAYGLSQLERGLKWFEYSMFFRERFRTQLTIGFAFVATHNHFVLDHGGRVFNRTAPIIKLPEGATEEDHLALLGYLNSSTLAFWGRQCFSSKGAQGVNEGIKTETWEQFLEFAGTPLAKAPVPTLGDDIRRIADILNRLAERREADMPRESLRRWAPGTLALRDTLQARESEAARTLARMCALQEELDWLVYAAVGLLTAEDEALLTRARGEVWPGFPTTIDDSPDAVEGSGLHPGHRAFEVVLARDSLVNGTSTAWFERNGYRSPSEITAIYSPACQRLIEARVAIIDRNPRIRLIEKPEFKRRWTWRSFGDEARASARCWLLDAAERLMTASTAPRTVREVEAEIMRIPGAPEVSAWIFGEDGGAGARDLLLTKAVPHLAPLRFSTAGQEKHAAWQDTWSLQRREDAGEKLEEPIPVPPKYDQKDYRDPVYWRLRGKLDVPKERFISYPGAERDDDRSPLIGWAGWDHLQRAQALAALYLERKNQDGWEKERLKPLLAGLLELVPWLQQWHNDPSDDPAKDRAGDAYARFVDEEARGFGFTPGDLRAWRPEEKRRHARSGAPRRAGEPETDGATAETGPADAASRFVWKEGDVTFHKEPPHRRKRKGSEAAE